MRFHSVTSQHMATAGSTRVRAAYVCAMPAAWSTITPFLGVNPTDKHARPRRNLVSAT